MTDLFFGVLFLGCEGFGIVFGLGRICFGGLSGICFLGCEEFGFWGVTDLFWVSFLRFVFSSVRSLGFVFWGVSGLGFEIVSWYCVSTSWGLFFGICVLGLFFAV